MVWSCKRGVHIDEMLDFGGGLRHKALSVNGEFSEAASESGQEIHDGSPDSCGEICDY